MQDSHPGGEERLRRAARVYARFALGAAFVSAVASRLGLWGDQSSGWDAFVGYTAEVNSFLPAALAPVLAVCATVAELALGLALLVGFQLPRTAVAAAALLAVFGAAMAISFGIKSAARLLGLLGLGRGAAARRVADRADPPGVS